VFKVRSRIDGWLYAIKRIKRGRRGCISKHDVASRRRALREVHALASLTHSAHVVRYFGAWFESSQLFIQLEWCDRRGLVFGGAALRQRVLSTQCSTVVPSGSRCSMSIEQLLHERRELSVQELLSMTVQVLRRRHAICSMQTWRTACTIRQLARKCIIRPARNVQHATQGCSACQCRCDYVCVCASSCEPLRAARASSPPRPWLRALRRRPPDYPSMHSRRMDAWIGWGSWVRRCCCRCAAGSGTFTRTGWCIAT
jgi:hypothetical protein